MERLKLLGITIGLIVFVLLSGTMWIWMPLLMWYNGAVSVPVAIVIAIGIYMMNSFLNRDLKGMYD